MKCIFLIVVGLTVAFSPADADSPYDGQELRSIKSISPEEIEGLKNGEGMGFAKLAELNHFPGPRHVLDLSQELDLTPFQLAETELLFAAMRSDAIELGDELLAAESALDRAFAEDEIDAKILEDALLKIGEIRARLRFVHLQAHLRQQHLLTEAQISLYDKSRGYGRKDSNHAGHSRHHE